MQPVNPKQFDQAVYDLFDKFVHGDIDRRAFIDGASRYAVGGMTGAMILDVLTPRQSEPYRRGHAYLHFFPDGHTERALIHIGPDSDNPPEDEQFSLLVHALTGRVEVLPGRAPTPRDFALGSGDDGVGKGGR